MAVTGILHQSTRYKPHLFLQEIGYLQMIARSDINTAGDKQLTFNNKEVLGGTDPQVNSQIF
jgi:hypothetical protein